MLLKIPTHTLTQRLQLSAFLIREFFFTLKQGVGIARTLKTQEITFMYKKQPFKKRQQKFYAIISNKNKLLNHAFRHKNKTKE